MDESYIARMLFTYIARMLFTALLSCGSHCRDGWIITACYAGVPLLGRVAIYSFVKLWVPAGTWANHAAFGRLSFLPTGGGGGGGRVGHVRRHFGILLVDSRFLGEGFSSPYSSSGMKMSLKKNWAGMDSFPFTDLLSLNILRQFLGTTHRFAHFFLRGLNVG